MMRRLIAVVGVAVVIALSVVLALAQPNPDELAEMSCDIAEQGLYVLCDKALTIPLEQAAAVNMLAQRDAELENAVRALTAPTLDLRDGVVMQLVAEGEARAEEERRIAEEKRMAEEKRREEERKKAEQGQAAAGVTVVGSGTGAQIAAKAQEYLGCAYVYGGSGPSSFDCSGLTMYVYGLYDYKLPHGATGQMNYGTAVDKSDLQPGDLVFFTSWNGGNGIGHVGIYVGDSNFVHASTERTGVITSSLDSGSYVWRYAGARRIF